VTNDKTINSTDKNLKNIPVPVSSKYSKKNISKENPSTLLQALQSNDKNRALMILERSNISENDKDIMEYLINNNRFNDASKILVKMGDNIFI